MNLPVASVIILHFDLSMIVLRVAHIFGGTLWAGSLWYCALFVLPGMSALAAETGGRLPTTAVRALQFMNVSGLIAILSGMILYGEISAGFSRGWIMTPRGIVLGAAGVVGILAVLEGWRVSRAAARDLRREGPAPDAVQIPPAREIRASAHGVIRSAYRSAYLGAIALVGMAAFRYLQ